MEKNKNYLVSFFSIKRDKKVVNEIKVLESTTTCYKIEFISDSSFGLGYQVEWIEKNDFEQEYIVLEVINRDFSQNIQSSYNSPDLFEEDEIIKSYHDDRKEDMTIGKLFNFTPLPPTPPESKYLKEEKAPKPKSWREVLTKEEFKNKIK